MRAVQQGLVTRAKNILVTPKTEWPVIDAEPSTIGDIYKRYVLILAAVPVVAGLIGNLLFGYSVMGMTFRMAPVTALSSAIMPVPVSVTVTTT